eukprot:TRINITY_DN7217_c0_g1_i1.p3 TRINITY_DN7217_c0_g1~~TRINITY_DN7217_c0_g1_i1.p3  ORF type:complete len:110 (-),score=8.22 TRINITY_DN7217_c0_g1_i1:48-377(-)
MENLVPPPFPQIHNNPSMPLVLKHMRITEWLGCGAVGAFFGGVAFFSQHARHMRGVAAGTGILIGTVGLFSHGYKNSAMRLMGYRENSSLVKRYPYRLDTVVKESAPVA